MALLGKFFGRTASEGAAYAFGVATGPVLAPATETVRQEAWKVHANRLPDAAYLAAGVAQGQVDEDTARAWAQRHGYGEAAFSAMLDIANVGPDVGTAMQAWRRGKLTETQFRTVLRRHAIEPAWTAAIEALKVELLGPADLARAIHRGLIDDPGLLQGELPAREGNVPAYPVYAVDALDEAAGSGYDRDRLGVLVGLQGNPMGAHEAAQAEFRGVLTHDDYLRAIAEGNTRNEWAEAIREQSRAIPSSTNYVAAFIRGWIDRAKMHAGAARHGMSAEDADLLALVSGRPVTTRQAFIGFIRGGRVQGQSWDERETFRRAVIQSNIRPEWEPILWAARYSYPSAFVLRSLVQSGDITPAEGEDVLLRTGWEPTFAAKVSRAWSTGGATTAKGLTVADLTAEYEGLTLTRPDYIAGLRELGYTVASATGKARVSDAKRRRQARNQLIARARTRFTAWRIDEPQARRALVAAKIDAPLQDELMASWLVEREINAADLTPAQIKKAYRKALMQRAEAEAELEARGYDATETGLLLDE